MKISGDSALIEVRFDIDALLDTGAGGAVQEQEREEKCVTKTKKKRNSQQDQLFSLCERRVRSDERGSIDLHRGRN